MKLQKQNGRVLLVLALIFMFVGIGVYYLYNNKAERRAAALVQAVQSEKDKKAKEESAATAQRMAAQKQTDALSVSLASVDSLMQRWYDAEQVASASSRMSLATPVAALQAIKREAEALTVPPCLDDSKPKLLQGMEGIVDAYLAFMTTRGADGDELVATKFKDARPHFIYFKSTRAACPVAAKQ